MREGAWSAISPVQKGPPEEKAGKSDARLSRPARKSLFHCRANMRLALDGLTILMFNEPKASSPCNDEFWTPVSLRWSPLFLNFPKSGRQGPEEG